MELSLRADRLIHFLAQNEAKKLGSEQLFPEHILLALVKSGDGLGYYSLQLMKINTLTLQLMLEQNLVKHQPDVGGPDRPPSNRVKTLLNMAALEARELKNDYVGTEHILLAAIREEQSVTQRFFAKAQIPVLQARESVQNVQSKAPTSGRLDLNLDQLLDKQIQENVQKLGNRKPVSSMADGFTAKGKNGQTKNSMLELYGRDLTGIARKGQMDPVVGRSNEIYRVIQILSRRTKNNPILIGEPGVGKTAIVEGIAQSIVKGDVPHDLLNKRVIALDLAAMVAGTKYRGEFEERMKLMMKEVLEAKNIILFIDELHTIIGAGGPEGSLDASNMLKPALSRGELQCIGATTTKEYRKYIEKDSALVRRFQSVRVEEPNCSDTESILAAIKPKYEDFHNVYYEDGVIQKIVKFSQRYIPERFLPDKAIDILDEAGAVIKIKNQEKNDELEVLQNEVKQLMEEKQQLVNTQDYEKAAVVRDKVLELKSKIEYARLNVASKEKARSHVTVDDVSKVISSITGIPLSNLDDGENTRLVNMENEIHKEVVGQEEAVNAICSSVRRSRTGVSSTKRPVGSFIFLGPTGVGKTQLAKTLAKFLFGTEDALIRIDMSDYMEKHNASRLVGAAPGYVGYEEGGVLTERVREKPYSVVLLDEIEKAHPDVFNLLLQVLEEGQLSDNLGHTVNFRNTVLIMTSNAGARKITSESRIGFSTVQDGILPYEDIKASAMEELKRIMAPELINRIDDIVVFNTLSHKEISKILDIQLDELKERLAEKNISLELKQKAREYLIQNGYEPSMGARPMRRLIQKELEDNLANLILKENIGADSTSAKQVKICVDLKNQKLFVSLKKNDSKSVSNKLESDSTRTVKILIEKKDKIAEEL